MKASIVDLRYKMNSVLKALERNEIVQIFYRGTEKASLVPATLNGSRGSDLRQLPAFGMWKNRKDLKDVDAHIRKLRKPRFDDL